VSSISVDYDVLNQKGSPAWYSDTFANIPTPGYKGRMFISTDTFAFYRDNGTGWDLVGGPGTGTITGAGVSGQVTYFIGTDTIGGNNNLFYDITNSRLGIGTATPGAPLDIHSTGTAAQFNGTGVNNSFVLFQNAGSSKWRIGNLYNSGANDYQIFDVTNSTARLTIKNTGASTLIGTFTATSLIKSGGTNLQILLADGSTTPTSTFGAGSVTNVSALTLGTTGTDLTSSVVNSTTTPVITLNVPTASATNRGALSSADWTTFNNKQGTISVTAPVVLTGATISMPAATTSVSGYLTSTDWNTFNSKTSNLGTVTDVVALTIGTTGIDITSTAVTTTTTPVITLNIPTASASNRGALSSTDWTIFNNKQATLSLTTTGTSGAATLVANTLNVPNYGSALSGYLPLSGGTLTGALGGTSATFSGNLTTNSGINYFNGASDSVLYYQIGGITGGHLYLTSTKLELNAYSTRNIVFETNGVTRLTIASTGGATFSSTGLFGGELSVGGTLSADRMFQVSGTAFTSGATQFGIVNNPTMHTPTTIYGYYGGVTVTSATTAYGMYIVSNAGTITNKFGLYQEGTNDKNYFGGSTGFGTTIPLSKLNVQDSYISVGSSSNVTTANTLLFGYGYILSGTTYGNVKITSSYNNATNQAGLEFYTDNGTSTERLKITSAGITQFKPNTGDLAGEIFYGATSTGAFVGDADNFIIGGQTSKGLVFCTNNLGQEKMRITTAGNVGIATTTPLSLLHIASADTDQGLRLTRANGTFGFRFTRTGLIQGTLTDGTTFQTAIELSEGNSSANNYLTLQPTAGNVGIGITPSNTKLQVLGNSLSVGLQSSYALGVGNSSGYDLTFGTDATYSYIQSWTSKPLRINSQGNNIFFCSGAGEKIGINTTTINSTLQINGNAAIGYSASTTATTNGLQVNGRGNFLNATDNALFSLNSGGTLYTVGFSPTATASSTNTLTLTTGQTTYIYTGSGTATWTLPNPSGTNQMFWIKNAGTGIITLNAYAGTNIINNAAASVSSITIAIGATALIQQDGNVKSYQLQ
jgi:hypothetical protein